MNLTVKKKGCLKSVILNKNEEPQKTNILIINKLRFSDCAQNDKLNAF